LAAVLDFYEIQYSHRFGWQNILCPFVPENVPSCRISLDEGGYKCMSCGAVGGDSIDFIRAKEHMDFVAAKEFCKKIPGERAAVDEPPAYSRRGGSGGTAYRPNFKRRRG
jgi:hypothetical protein